MSHCDLLKLLDKAPQVASDLLQGLSLNLANRLRETNTDVLVKGGEHEYTLQHAEPSPNTPGRHESLLVRLRTLLGIGE